MKKALRSTIIVQEHISSSIHQFLTQNGYLKELNKIPIPFHRIHIKDDLCMDSLDIVDLILFLEDRFQIEFEGSEMPPIETIGDLEEYACELLIH